MSNPNKPAPSPAPSPAPVAPPPAAPAPVSEAELASKVESKKKELDKIKQEKELQLLEAEIERIKNGGKSAQMVAVEKKKLSIREKTYTEELNGKKVAKYLVPDRSYMPLLPGQPPKLNPERTIVTVEFDSLPGQDWLPVEKAPVAPSAEFKPA